MLKTYTTIKKLTLAVFFVSLLAGAIESALAIACDPDPLCIVKKKRYPRSHP
ncbi:MAG: hypothetical protein AB4290_16095 [Spirulina sp.]